MHTSEQLPRAGLGQGVCVAWFVPSGLGGQVGKFSLPDLPVLFPSFITFRSCAYLDKKHTIFGR